MRILIVEDDKQTALTLKDELSRKYLTEVSYTGEEGEHRAQINVYDLIIIDYLLPNLSGVEVCRHLREAKIKIPILMLTGKNLITDKVMALDAGADDYLTKPFSFEELQARIRALLRRPQETIDSNILVIGDLVIDLNTRKVNRSGKIISLRKKELYLLEYLARNVGRVITRDMILDHVWQSLDDPATNIVDVHIKYLRDAVDKSFDKKLIKTVHGMGYKLEA